MLGWRQFFKMCINQIKSFILIGIINTMFYYSLYILMLYLGASYFISAFFATACGIVLSYILFGKFVFYHRSFKSSIKFILVYFILYILNITLIAFFYNYVHNYYLGGLLATICCAVISFLFNKFFVFTKEKEKKLE
jgi:putative flippase GtrA